MFLHLSVILSTGECAWQGACMAGGMHGRGVCGRGHAWQRGCMVGGGACAWQGAVCGGRHAWWGACVAGGCTWQGRGACVAGWRYAWQGCAWQGGMHSGGGHVWQGACMARRCASQGACVAGDVHGRGHAWQGGMHGRGCAWQGACACHTPPPRHYDIRSVNARAARILLECILVASCDYFTGQSVPTKKCWCHICNTAWYPEC